MIRFSTRDSSPGSSHYMQSASTNELAPTELHYLRRNVSCAPNRGKPIPPPCSVNDNSCTVRLIARCSGTMTTKTNISIIEQSNPNSSHNPQYRKERICHMGIVLEIQSNNASALFMRALSTRPLHPLSEVQNYRFCSNESM